MKRFSVTIFVVLLIGEGLLAQQITNVRTETKNGRIEITYDLIGISTGIVSVKARSSDGSEIMPDKVFGDIEKVQPGRNKAIWWEPQLEGRTTSGWTISLNVVRDIGIRWIFVGGGAFQMGSNVDSDERPVHTVKVSDFYISETEITFEQYDKFCEETGRDKPSDNGWGRGTRPVINLSWNDAVAYCEWASKVTGMKIRLPYEAEWEYAARGGNKSRGYKYSGSDDINSVAWYSGNSGSKTQPVKSKQPNELGIYDMSGNVWEWCADWYDENYYSKSPSENPKGPASGEARVLRGGSWLSHDNDCRVAFRLRFNPDLRLNGIGFRVAREN